MTNNKPKGRGGRRPGAGAPRGNLNALKHGGRSRQFARLGALLATSPEVREALLSLGVKHFQKQQRAEEVAAEILGRLYAHARDVAAGIDSPGPFRELAGLNAARKPLSGAQSKRTGRRTHRPNAPDDKSREIHAAHNQNPHTNGAHNQPPDREKPVEAVD